MGREQNVREFEDTARLYSSDPDLLKAVEDSIKRQRIIYETEPLREIARRFDSTDIIVNKDRSLQVARNRKGRVCVLNFASSRHPGGNVVGGSSAQEESICRISTLYPCLTDGAAIEGFYKRHGPCSKLYNSDIIYTPDVKVFKTDSNNPITLPKSLWYDVDIITCAAPNLRETRISLDTLYGIQRSRIGRICNAAMSNGADVLILGAFGCGVFMNDPTTVARAFRDALSEYDGCFREAVFPIYSPKDDGNYAAFAKVLKNSA